MTRKVVLARDFVSPARDTHDREVCRLRADKKKTSNLSRLSLIAVVGKQFKRNHKKPEYFFVLPQVSTVLKGLHSGILQKYLYKKFFSLIYSLIKKVRTLVVDSQPLQIGSFLLSVFSTG